MRLVSTVRPLSPDESLLVFCAGELSKDTSLIIVKGLVLLDVHP